MLFRSFPWALQATRALSTEWWDYAAFTAHFITGLRDVYEHTFDSWDRIQDDWHCDQLLCTDYRVEQAAEDYQQRYYGAAQFQMVFQTEASAEPSREQRDEIFATLMGPNLKLIETLTSGALQ